MTKCILALGRTHSFWYKSRCRVQLLLLFFFSSSSALYEARNHKANSGLLRPHSGRQQQHENVKREGLPKNKPDGKKACVVNVCLFVLVVIVILCSHRISMV